ncbi:MAG: hypothetical protein M3O62_13960 [Pseudomonadota bacterium]|nr:hypothetical protein [Pseudomonadota bacterium]
MWFDDFYHPESEKFAVSFTPTQLDALKTFHSVFEAQSNELSEDFSSWKAETSWMLVSKAATEALNVFPHAES